MDNIQEYGFCDLEHRDEFSVKCALGNTMKIMPLLKERNQTHYAVANLANASGWVQQLFKCKDNDITPLLGMVLYVCNYDISAEDDRVIDLLTLKSMLLKDMGPDMRDLVTMDFPLTVYARTVEGYYNVIQMHNDAQLKGVSRGLSKRPTTTDGFIQDHGKGVVALMPAYSEVAGHIYNNREDLALKKLDFYKSVFDDVYLEVVISENMADFNDSIVAFAEKHSFKYVPVCESRYIREEDKEAYGIMQGLSKLRNGVSFEAMPGTHYKSMPEVEDTFNKHHLRDDKQPFNTETWNKSLVFLNELLSSFTLLDLDYDLKLPKFKDGAELLRKKAIEGFMRNKYHLKGQEYSDRLEYELDNIVGAGFENYFLVLAEMFDWYKNDVHGITCFGRGSAAGSLTLNCIGCTDVDPIKENLLFERFLDAERFKAIVQSGGKVSGNDCPDVDSDWSTTKRDAVKAHLSDKYGKNMTSSIGTIGTMKTKSVLKDLARLYEIPNEVINAVTAGEMREYVDDDTKSIEELRQEYPGLDKLLQAYPKMAEVFETLRGSVANYGVHAAGVLIGNLDLTKHIPLRLDEETGGYVTCWQEGLQSRELGMMGYIKFDLLAIDQLNIFEATLEMIRQRHGINIDVKKLNLEEKAVLKQMEKQDTSCVFQFDTDLAPKVIKNMGGIKSFDDICSLTTLVRPASLINGFDRKFGTLRDGNSAVYVPECLEKHLGATMGLPIFQEHIYQAATEMAGMSKNDSYQLMKKIYKNKLHDPADVQKWHDKFISGCRSKVEAGEVDAEYPEKLWTQMLAFMGYGFCKCLGLDTVVETEKGLIELQDVNIGDKVKAPGEDFVDEFVEVLNVWEREEELYEVELENGKKIKSSLEHKFLCEDGKMRRLKEIIENDLKIVTE